jgi:hypothetical protein
MAQATSQYQLIIGGGGMMTLSTDAVPLVTTATPCQMIQIRSISTNTGPIAICNSTALLATTGRVGILSYPGSTSETVTIYAKDVSGVYIDGISTEAVSYVYYVVSVGNG